MRQEYVLKPIDNGWLLRVELGDGVPQVLYYETQLEGMIALVQAASERLHNTTVGELEAAYVKN
jgi:hypothetical protein